MQGEDVIISGELKQEAYDQLKASTDNLTLSMDDNGKVTAVANSGATLTEAEQNFLDATKDPNITVNLEATDKNITDDGTSLLVGGAFKGSTVNPDGTVTANQIVNPNHMDIIDTFTGRGSGVGTLHEVLEAYVGAKNFPGAQAASNEVQNEAYDFSHNEARRIDPRHIEIQGTKTMELPKNNGKTYLQMYIGSPSRNKMLWGETLTKEQMDKLKIKR